VEKCGLIQGKANKAWPDLVWKLLRYLFHSAVPINFPSIPLMATVISGNAGFSVVGHFAPALTVNTRTRELLLL
jgi:ABC-type transport system involved in cytochrome c biogenesis permease component